MQTFLPYSDFKKVATVLDKQRCWKQSVENKQIISTLRLSEIPNRWKETDSYISQKWIKHPAIAMWIGYDDLLKYYHNAILEQNIKVHKYNTKIEYLEIDKKFDDIEKPFWFNNEQFHRSHRSRLIEKNKEFYLPLFPDDENYNESKYWWPDLKTKTFRTI